MLESDSARKNIHPNKKQKFTYTGVPIFGMQKIFAQISSWISQIIYRQTVLKLTLERTIVSKSRFLHV